MGIASSAEGREEIFILRVAGVGEVVGLSGVEVVES